MSPSRSPARDEATRPLLAEQRRSSAAGDGDGDERRESELERGTFRRNLGTKEAFAIVSFLPAPRLCQIAPARYRCGPSHHTVCSPTDARVP